MVKHVKNDVAISDQIDKEIKAVLRDQLGAELVESVDPMYADDPAVPNMKYTFQDAFAEILPHTMPEYFWQKTRTGELEFAVPGWDVTSVDYLVALAMHKAPLSPKLDAAAHQPRGSPTRAAPFVIEQVPRRARRRAREGLGDLGRERQVRERRAAGVGASTRVGEQDPRADPNGISYLKMQSALRMVILKVMYENGIDVFVNPEQTTRALQAGLRRRARGQRSAADQLLHGVHRAAAACRRWTCRPASRRSATTRSTS